MQFWPGKTERSKSTVRSKAVDCDERGGACKSLSIYCTLRLVLNHPDNSETINFNLSEYWDHCSSSPNLTGSQHQSDALAPAKSRTVSSS